MLSFVGREYSLGRRCSDGSLKMTRVLIGRDLVSRPFIVLGDKTDHGGVVISASESSDCDGKGVARVGDKVTCPKKGHGNVTTIVTGDSTALIDGRPAARHGDRTACGATLISSQSLTTD